MTLEDFKKLLTKEELEKYSETDINRLFKVACLFANYSFKDWVEKKVSFKKEQ